MKTPFITCEAKCQDMSNPDKGIFLCGKSAPYTCIYCMKHFCIDCMYLLCDGCHKEISCFHCGFPIKYEVDGTKLAKHYCNECKE
ncbi:hypothetical protein QKU48_gp1082 [Fadolivirus algeromassiliense]|jgi:hypothetical protein|uniref:Uncharacterized protein n=1 Tax=Fadolivirus FV1/VV64 TaxID=3070911 RepID=A0A7D3QXJ5_9VIRU|nr:hypothetical protein QKU48_gp1082 [Fadolivirus algeromassiliense]QKF94540.1 hypothetical protein Fadolivirus_1_1082 [Fadolivirus FV1/VV64]